MERDELEEMIRAGWGDLRRDRVPADWRTRKPPTEGFSEYMAPRVLRGALGRYAATLDLVGLQAIALAQAAMANEIARRKIGRPKGTVGIKHREREQRIIAGEAHMKQRVEMHKTLRKVRRAA